MTEENVQGNVLGARPGGGNVRMSQQQQQLCVRDVQTVDPWTNARTETRCGYDDPNRRVGR